jgi:hypothetical protein
MGKILGALYRLRTNKVLKSLKALPEKPVFFTKLDRLLPPIIALVQIGGDSPELDEFVLLQLLRQRNVIEVVKGVDGGPQALVVLLVDEQAVEGLVNGLVVKRLDGAQVGLNQLQVIRPGEIGNGPRVVHARRQHQQYVVQQQGLVLHVKLDGFIIKLDVRHLGDDVLEVALAPRLGRMLHHREDRVVVLLVFVVQEDELGPKVSRFGGA